MFNRKIASLALLAAFAAPTAFAADVITSDGRPGGAFWGQPVSKIIAPSNTAQNEARGPFVVGRIDPSDGRLGGAYWGAPNVAKQQVMANQQATERFVPTAQARSARPFAFLEDYNN